MITLFSVDRKPQGGCGEHFLYFESAIGKKVDSPSWLWLKARFAGFAIISNIEKCCLLFFSLMAFSIGQCWSQIILPGDTSFCQGGQVILRPVPTGTSYQWFKSPSTTPVGTSTTYTATVSGNYYVAVTTAGVPTTYTAVTITVNPKPVAAFTFLQTSVCSSVPVQFTDQSVGAVSYLWNFGDPNSGASNLSALQNPVHTFIGANQGGTQSFTVTLKVTNSFGCDSVLIKQNVITFNQPSSKLRGTGFIDPNIFKGCNIGTTTFTFINQSSTNNSGYEIIWGNGPPNFTAGPSFTSTNHTYTAGDYMLKFIVTGANNCVDTGIYRVFVGTNPGGGPVPPGATSGCIGKTIAFSFAPESYSNPLGTIYHIKIDDGTDTILPQPPPLSFIHTFNQNSCSRPGSTFTLNYTVENPCDITPGQFSNIKISDKPVASFTISPKDTVCTGSQVSFIAPVQQVVSGSACVPIKVIWTITPGVQGVDWNPAPSSSFGNTFGLSNPSAWIGGSNNFGVIFIRPGNYQIKLLTGDFCGTEPVLDSITKSICVNPAPAATYTLDTVSGCAPLTVHTATTVSTTPTCGTNKFKWTITYTSTGCVPLGASYTYLSGDSTSKDPVIRFNNPGRYTLSLVVFSPASACSTIVPSRQITVRGKPNISFSLSSAAICQNECITVTRSASCDTASSIYAWSFPGGNPPSSPLTNPGTVCYPTPGTYPVTWTATNGCGFDTMTKMITVKAQPSQPNAYSNSPVCANDTLRLYADTIPSVTYNWTGPPRPPYIPSALQNPVVPGITTAGNGTYTVTVSQNGCTSLSKSIIVKVNPRPAKPLPCLRVVNYCLNDTAAALCATATPGNTLSWCPAYPLLNCSPNVPTPLTNVVGIFRYYVVQKTDSSGCTSDTSIITVNVQPIPIVSGSSFINPLTCSSATGSITLNGLTPNTTYTIHYNYNGPPAPATVLHSNSSGTIVIQNLVAGIYTNVTVTPAGGCTSAPVGPFNLSDPNPPPSPVPTFNRNPLCTGDTLQLGISPPQPSGTTYAWTGPHGSLGTLQNPILNNVTTADSGPYSVVAIVSGCSSTPATLNIIVNPNPPVPVPGSNSICSGDTLKLFSNVSSASNYFFQWTGPGNFFNTLPNPVIPNATPSASGTYSLVITNTTTGCRSAAGTVAVVIRPTPVISSTSFSNPTGCASSNGTITLMGLTPTVKYKIFYRKDNGVIVTDSLTTDASGNITIPNLAAGTYTDISVSLNSCNSNIAGPLTLNYTPPFTAVASGTTSLCDGGQLNLFANPSTTAAASYDWKGPNGFSSNLQNPVVNPATILYSGNYKLTININGCVSSDSINITVSPKPVGGDTYSDTTVCNGTNTGIIRLRSQYGSVQQWEVSTDNGLNWSIIVNNTSSYTFSNLSASSWYRIAVKNGTCPIAYSDTTKISVVPTVTAVKFEPQFYSTCNHDTTFIFSGSAIYTGSGSIRYSWFINSGLVNGNTNPLTYRFRTPLHATQSTVYNVVVVAQNSLGCADTSAMGNITILPLPGASIRVTPSIVQDEPNIRFTFDEVSQASATTSYIWQMGDRGNHIRNGKLVTFDYEGPGTYNVVLKVRDDGTTCIASDSVKVTIRAVPGKLYVPDAFYPNSGVYKDRIFKPEGIGLESYRMQIFDTWGRLLFETTQLYPDGSPKESWNGTDFQTGKPLPQGAYVWKIDAKFKNGKTWDGMSYKGGPPVRFHTVDLFR